MQQEITRLEQRLKDGQSSIHAQKEEHFAFLQQSKKFIVELHNVLLNIRHKYADDELVQGQVDMTIKNEFTAVNGTTEIDQHLQQSICVLELANMIGNITNVLNFELKAASVRNQQISELEQQVEKARLKSQDVIEKNELQMKISREEIEQACE